MKNKCYYKDGTTSNEYDPSKVLHRVDQPAYISYYQSGEVRYEQYYLDGKLHRVDQPAYISYYQSGEVYYEYYYLDGKIHRIDQPASIEYYQSGEVRYERYFLDNKPHRVDGPTYIVYLESGDVDEYYYLDGVAHSKQEYSKILLEIKSLDEGSKLIDPRVWVRTLENHSIFLQTY